MHHRCLSKVYSFLIARDLRMLPYRMWLKDDHPRRCSVPQQESVARPCRSKTTAFSRYRGRRPETVGEGRGPDGDLVYVTEDGRDMLAERCEGVDHLWDGRTSFFAWVLVCLISSCTKTADRKQFSR